MRFFINGQIEIINFQERQPSLELLVNELNLNPKLIVVEFNGVILNQQKWGSQKVKDDDRLEIVTIVGGG